MAEIIDGMSRGIVPGLFNSAPAADSLEESPVPGVREAHRARLAYIAENNRRGEATARQREKAEREFEKNITASQLAQRENVSPRLYSLILKLETEKVKK
jgi:hypothetical protein